MDQIFQAVVMGVVQGLTEFLPISSSGHLILVPYLLGWDDPFLQSLAFSVVISAGTLAALLVYFREDWLRLVPAGFATIRDRSFQGDPDRKLAWLIAVATIPAAVAGFLFNDVFEEVVRKPGLVAVMLLVGAAILWLADRWGSRLHKLAELSFVSAFVIGAAQALALIPGVSRSGISISAGLFAGLDREGAARFSFLMATPITALALVYEGFKIVKGDVRRRRAGADGRRRDRGVRLRDRRDRVPAALRPDALVRDLRRLPDRARGHRHRRLPASIGRAEAGPWRS